MSRPKLFAVLFGILSIGGGAFYFNATSIRSDLKLGSGRLSLGSGGSGSEIGGGNTEIDTDAVPGIDGDTSAYEDEPMPTHDFEKLEEERMIHTDPITSIDTGLEAQSTPYGYSLDINKETIKWYLQDEDGTLIKKDIPFSKFKVANMENIVTNQISKRFPRAGTYISYPTVGAKGENAQKRIRKKDLIASLTLLESMWEKHGGDNYGTLLDENGDPMKVFSPDITMEIDEKVKIKYGELEPYNEELSSNYNKIQDFFINSARASEGYSIPFEIFDRTWGNTNLFGFRGKLTGSIGLWGNAEEGGSFTLSTDMDLSAYIFGNRKNFMHGKASTRSECDLRREHSSFYSHYDLKKWGSSIHSSLPYTYSNNGVCRGQGRGTISDSYKANSVRFDGFDACLQWRVFAGLKVRGCAGVKGNTDFDYSALGMGATNIAYIKATQSMPYYGSASLALSPAGFDLAELSMNVEGKILDMEHTFDSSIKSSLDATHRDQKVDLIYQQKILGGRVFLKIRWWSVVKWGYKSWVKEIKPNGWSRNESRTTDLLRNLR